MNKIEITPELLADLKEKAQCANRGPWGLDLGPAPHIVFIRQNRCPIGDIEGFNDAAYIAAVSPDVVLALVERIGKLEKDLYGLCHDDEEKVCRIERLEKETDWLARKLFEVCRNNDCGHACAGKRSCPLLRWKRCPVDGYVNSWREAARKAVEAENE